MAGDYSLHEAAVDEHEVRPGRLVTCVPLLVAAVSCSQSEPLYSGKPLSYWRRQLEDHNPEVSQPAALALARMGAVAVPTLLRLVTSDTHRSKALGVLAHIGRGAVEGVPALLDMAKSMHGIERGTICHCLSYIVEPDAVVALDVVHGLIDNLQSVFDSGDTSRTTHDLAFIASVPFDDRRVFEVVRRGARFTQEVSTMRQCILALGRGSRWAPDAVKELESLLRVDDAQVVSAALEAVAMRKDDVAHAVPALIDIISAPTGIVGRPEGSLRSVIESGAEERHACSSAILKKQGPRLVPLYSSALKRQRLSLFSYAAGIEKMVDTSGSSDTAMGTFEDREALFVQAAGMLASQEACRRLANLLRSSGDDGMRELRALESWSIGGNEMTWHHLSKMGFQRPDELWRHALLNAKPPQ